MSTIVEGSLTFDFPANCRASKYDDWSFYRNQFQPIATSSMAVDIVCVTADTCWLIEIKDYRQHPRTKTIDIVHELATKVRDTLAGLASAVQNSNNTNERQLAGKALAKKRRWRVVLHLEQPATHRKLWPKPIDTAKLLQKLRTKTLKGVDAHPIVCDRNSIAYGIPWTVA